MDIFASVKARVGVREAAERYGVRVNGRGMARCPFHDDRRPSLYVADGHFHGSSTTESTMRPGR